MTAAELSNLGICGAADVLGTNTEKGCADIIIAAHSIWLLRPSLVIPVGTTINLAYITTLQKAGDLIVIQGINTFEENGSDDAIETLDDDTMIKTNLGKYKFLATFTHGLYFQEALGSVEGFSKWRTVIVDKEGSILLTSHITGGYKGFKTGLISRKKLQFPSNTTGLKQGLEWQLLERFEMDDNYVLWQSENLGFDPRQVEPVTQVELSLVNAPAATDTAITVKAVVRRGRQDAVAAALFGQWLQTIDGGTENPTAGDDSATAGTYVLVIGALSENEVGTFQMYDNSNNSNIIEIAGDGLYKSNILNYVVTS